MNRFAQTLLASFGCALAAVSFAAEPWDAPPFSASAKAIAEAAGRLPVPEQESAYEILLNESRYQFDEDGRCQASFHVIYRVLDAAAVENAGLIEAAWAPWYQDKPSLRARVITSSGEEHELDPKNVAEVPAEQSGYILTDRKRLRAPLPGIRVGAVVEREIVTKDTRPFFSQGTTLQVEWDSFFPQRIVRLEVLAAASLPLRYEARGCRIEPQRSEHDGKVKLVFESTEVPARQPIEALQPPQTTRYPYIALATGKSWEAVARGYHDVVEKQLGDAELKPVIGPLLEKGGSREQIIARLVQHMQGQVQYTGLVFGEAAIVPRPPLETLSRRFGDCKDQSTLLVAMLRAAGMEADVALLNAGAVEDFATEMPGLGAFNHAIVYVAGEPPLWIDPTTPYAPLGELPLADQGRLSLIASAKSTGLVRTPQARSAENRYLETHVVNFSDPQAAKVSITLESVGTPAHNTRASYAQQSAKNLRKSWEDFFQQSYRVGTLAHFSYSDPKDLTECRTRAEATGISFAASESGGIACPINTSSVLERLPPLLFPRVEADTDEEPGLKPRKTPLVLLENHTSEFVARYVPPAGYVPVELPENRKFTVGPATVSRTFQVADDHALNVRFRLDTGDGRFTSEQVESLRDALGQIGEGGALGPWNFVLNFEMAASRDSIAGRHRAALAEFARLLTERPEDAALHSQYGFALLRAGFGEAARAAGQRATALAPQSPSAWHHLGTILTHDLVGRPWRTGCDWSGARTAFEKGLEIDADHEMLQFERAILLERDPKGLRHTSDMDRQACLAAYAKARRKFPANELLRLNYELNLLECGKFEELQREAGKKPQSANDQSLLLAAMAATKDAAAAIRQADSLPGTPEQRRNLLLAAGDYLLLARKYPLAVALWETGARGNPAEARIKKVIETTRSFKHYEEQILDESRPEQVVRRLYVAMQLGGREQRESRQLFADPPKGNGTIDEWDSLREALTPRLVALENGQAGPERRADLMANQLTLKADGNDETGYRVIASGEGLRPRTWFVVKRAEGYKIVSLGETYSGWGEAALRSLADSNPDQARQYLRWAYDVFRAQVNLFDPYAGAPFAKLWSMSDASSVDDMRLAATALAASGPRREEYAKQLLLARGGLTESRVKVQVDRELSLPSNPDLLTPENAEVALAAADRLLEALPKLQWPLNSKVWLLDRLGRGDEGEAILRKRLEESPNDRTMKHILAQHLARLGKLEEAQELLRPLAAGSKTGMIESSLAWNALFVPPVTSTALDDAKKCVERYPAPDSMHTLAAVYAELDMPEEAHKTLLQVIEMRPNGIDHADYLVLGRLAEGYGVPQIAAECYRKVQLEKHRGKHSAWHLARSYLKRLESK